MHRPTDISQAIKYKSACVKIVSPSKFCSKCANCIHTTYGTQPVQPSEHQLNFFAHKIDENIMSLLSKKISKFMKTLVEAAKNIYTSHFVN